MAISRRKKPAKVRRPSRRRVNEIQRLHDEALQTIEAFYTEFCKKVDTYWNSVPKRTRRFIWSDLLIGSREVPGKIHNPLPDEVFRAVGLQPVRLATKVRGIRGSSKPHKASRHAVKRRRLPRDAGTSIPEYPGDVTPARDETVPGSGEPVPDKDGGSGHSGGERSSSGSEVPTDG